MPVMQGDRAVAIGDRGCALGVDLVDGLGFIENHPLDRVGKLTAVSVVGDAEYGPRIVEHVVDAIVGIVRVDRQECCTGFRDRPDRDDLRGGPRQTQRHKIFGTDAAPTQRARQLRRFLVELAVGHRPLATREGWGIRVRGDCFGEDLRPHPRSSRGGTGCRHQGSCFVGAEDADVGDTCCGFASDSVQDQAQSVGKPTNGGGFEEIGCEVEGCGHPSRDAELVELLVDDQLQVLLREFGFHGQSVDVEAG